MFATLSDTLAALSVAVDPAGSLQERAKALDLAETFLEARAREAANVPAAGLAPARVQVDGVQRSTYLACFEPEAAQLPWLGPDGARALVIWMAADPGPHWPWSDAGMDKALSVLEGFALSANRCARRGPTVKEEAERRFLGKAARVIREGLLPASVIASAMALWRNPNLGLFRLSALPAVELGQEHLTRIWPRLNLVLIKQVPAPRPPSRGGL